MSGFTILGYVVIAIGCIVAVWGGMSKPVSFTNSEFMAYLTGASVLVTGGIALVSNAPRGLLLTVLWITAAITLIYLLGLQWELWVFALSAVAVLGIAAWLTFVVFKRS